MRVLRGRTLVGGLSDILGNKDNCWKTTISNEGIMLPLHAEGETYRNWMQSGKAKVQSLPKNT
jgi:hypothetical protein